MTFILKQELLIEKRKIRFIDVRFYLDDKGRAEKEYIESRLPGALFADMELVLSDSRATDSGRHPLPPSSRFLSWLYKNSLYPWDQNTLIVCYDNYRGEYASRAWWMLRSLGCTTAVILYDGFLSLWNEVDSFQKLVENKREPVKRHYPNVDLVDWGNRKEYRPANSMDLLESSVFDVRSPERFLSEACAVYPDTLAGHYEGAQNLFYGDCDPYSAETKAKLVKLQPSEIRPSIVMCGSGITSCYVIACMDHLGLSLPMLFVGSWSELEMIEHRKGR